MKTLAFLFALGGLLLVNSPASPARENTLPEHLELSVEAFDRLATEAIGWVAAR